MIEFLRLEVIELKFTSNLSPRLSLEAVDAAKHKFVSQPGAVGGIVFVVWTMAA